MVYIVISNLTVEEAVIESEENGFCLIRLPKTGARFSVRKSRIYETRDKAAEHVRANIAPGPSPTMSRRPTPYDYEPGGARWTKERAVC